MLKLAFNFPWYFIKVRILQKKINLGCPFLHFKTANEQQQQNSQLQNFTKL